MSSGNDRQTQIGGEIPDEESFVSIWQQGGVPEDQIESMRHFIRNPDKKIGEHSLRDLVEIARSVTDGLDTLD